MPCNIYDDDQLHSVCEAVARASRDADTDHADGALIDRIVATYGLNTPRPTDTEREEALWDGVDRLKDILNATDTAAVERAMHVLGPAAKRPCDASTIGLMTQRGVNAFALHALETALIIGGGPRGMTIVTLRDDGVMLEAKLHLLPRGRTDGTPPWDHAEMEMAPGIRWDGTAFVAGEGVLPATVLNSLPGTPVTRLFNLPGMIDTGLHFTRIEEDDGRVHLLTDRRVQVADWHEACHWIRGEGP